MSHSIETVGIVGFGPMGRLVTEKMLPGMKVIACDPQITEKQIGNTRITDIDEVSGSDAVIMAVPARHLESAVEAVTRDMPDETLLVDISSVKIFPGQVFRRFWSPDYPSLLCHPLFGPQSAADGLEGHNLIVTEQYENESGKATQLLRLWGRLGLNIVRLTADEHDRQMAEVHAKTFILGRLATIAGDVPAQFDPPSRRAVEMLEALDAAHSQGLFESIVDFNPYAREMIEKMRRALTGLSEPDPMVVAMLERNKMLAEDIERKWA